MVVLRGGQLATRIRHLELWWIAETLRFAEPLLVQNASRGLPRADSIMTVISSPCTNINCVLGEWSDAPKMVVCATYMPLVDVQ
jgi:hypothetical protein